MSKQPEANNETQAPKTKEELFALYDQAMLGCVTVHEYHLNVTEDKDGNLVHELVSAKEFKM